MTPLSQLRAKIAETIRTGVSDLRDVDVTQGQVSVDEFKLWLHSVPAARVACLGLDQAKDVGDNNWEYDANFAVFVITRDAGKVEREAMAMGIVEKILGKVPGTTWGFPDIGAAENPRAENLYTTLAGKDGVSLWLIRWVHRISITSSADSGELDDFATGNITFDLAPPDGAIEAEDTIQLETDR